VSTIKRFLVIHDFIFQFVNYDLLNLIKARSIKSSIVPQLAACLPGTRVTCVQVLSISYSFFHLVLFYLFIGTMSVMALEITISSFKFLFSFFGLSHSRTREVSLVSQDERLKIHQYFTTV
jgi:hypothetical protein